MAKKTVRLTEDEVHARVGSYEQSAVTDKLYEFGKLLIAANRERTKALEDKAATLTGYSVAVLAFLVSREPMTSIVVGSWPPKFIVAAGGCAVAALACVGWVLFVRNHPWLSDSQWFENEDDVLQDADSLQRCHILAMHAANRALTSSNDLKANGILGGQVALILAGLCFAGWLITR